jgi:hypothetical protein
VRLNAQLVHAGDHGAPQVVQVPRRQRVARLWVLVGGERPPETGFGASAGDPRVQPLLCVRPGRERSIIATE